MLWPVHVGRLYNARRAQRGNLYGATDYGKQKSRAPIVLTRGGGGIGSQLDLDRSLAQALRVFIVTYEGIFLSPVLLSINKVRILRIEKTL